MDGFTDCKFKAFTRSIDAMSYWNENCRRNHHHPEVDIKGVSTISLTSSAPLATTFTTLPTSAPSPNCSVPTLPPVYACLQPPVVLPQFPQSSKPSYLSSPPVGPCSTTPSPQLPTTSSATSSQQVRMSCSTSSVACRSAPSRKGASVRSTTAACSVATSQPALTSLNSDTPLPSVSPDLDSTPSSPTSLSSSTSSCGYFSSGTVYGVAILGVHIIYSDRCVVLHLRYLI